MINFSLQNSLETYMTKKPPKDLVVVGIDDVTFGDIQDQNWPFRREYHANVINRLHRDGAKLIVMDIQFTEASCGSKTYEQCPDDNDLIEACRAARNCVLSTTELDPKGRSRVFGGAEGLKYARATSGDGRFPQDPDGVMGRPTLANSPDSE